MKLKEYIYPHIVWKSLKGAIADLGYYRRYKSILEEIDSQGKLESMNIKKDGDKMYIGVNLNPELLMYTEDSRDSVELKFVSDAMIKYTNFLQNEGILDSIKADYDRIYNEDFYGYIVQISYAFKKYKKNRFRYDIGYFLAISTIIATGFILLISSL